MKRLTLFRHAKSSWDDASLQDWARPLNARGRIDAPAMAQAMRQRDLRPDAIVCSTAVRARETLAHLGKGFLDHPDVRLTDTLYLAEPEQILDVVATAAPAADHVMVIGHNPGLHLLALSLADPRDGDIDQLRDNLPTASLAVLDLTCDDWSAAPRIGGSLTLFLRPRDLVQVS